MECEVVGSNPPNPNPHRALLLILTYALTLAVASGRAIVTYVEVMNIPVAQVDARTPAWVNMTPSTEEQRHHEHS